MPAFVCAAVLAAPLVIVPSLAARAETLAPEHDGQWTAELAGHVLGPPALAERLVEEAARLPGPVVVLADDYHLSSLIAWHGRGRWPTLPLERHHFRQITHWYEEGAHDGWDALYVEKADETDARHRLVRTLDGVEALDDEVVRLGGVTVARWTLHRGRGFRGPLGPAPSDLTGARLDLVHQLEDLKQRVLADPRHALLGVRVLLLQTSCLRDLARRSTLKQ